MGPRSDNRGYVPRMAFFRRNHARLQWVHGQITVVMVRRGGKRHELPSQASFNGSTVR